MTIDRACEILDPEHREHYESIEPVNEACRMAIKALRAQQWISVEDRLPDKMGKYLVFHHEWSDGAFLPTYEDCTIRAMRFMNNNKWRYPVCIDKRCEADTHREVTHWMPLPEPPEKKGK
jgi:hypothetical protein